MPLTINLIPNATPFAPFASDIQIFSNTKAREAPARLTSIALALKAHVDGAWLGVASDYLNNVAITALNSALVAIQTLVNGLETHINDKLIQLEASLSTYLGIGAGYSVGAVNDALFTGAIASGAIIYDANGRVAQVVQGPKKLSSIVYNTNGSLASYVEILNLSGIASTKLYSFTYDASGNLASIAEN